MSGPSLPEWLVVSVAGQEGVYLVRQVNGGSMWKVVAPIADPTEAKVLAAHANDAGRVNGDARS